MSLRKIVIGITGASGAIYAKILLEKLVDFRNEYTDISVVFSNNAKGIWEHELRNNFYQDIPFKIYDNIDFLAPFASGSANYGTMIICPCSMGSLGRIANGISDDLITRAADVILKERRKLILVTRETPLNLIHINNMRILTEAGGVIMPASPSFYSHPVNIEELVSTVIDRVLDIAGLSNQTFRWGDS